MMEGSILSDNAKNNKIILSNLSMEETNGKNTDGKHDHYELGKHEIKEVATSHNFTADDMTTSFEQCDLGNLRCCSAQESVSHKVGEQALHRRDPINNQEDLSIPLNDTNQYDQDMIPSPRDEGCPSLHDSKKWNNEKRELLLDSFFYKEGEGGSSSSGGDDEEESESSSSDYEEYESMLLQQYVAFTKERSSCFPHNMSGVPYVCSSGSGEGTTTTGIVEQ